MSLAAAVVVVVVVLVAQFFCTEPADMSVTERLSHPNGLDALFGARRGISMKAVPLPGTAGAPVAWALRWGRPPMHGRAAVTGQLPQIRHDYPGHATGAAPSRLAVLEAL